MAQPFITSTASASQMYQVWCSNVAGFERQPICFFGVAPSGDSRALGDTAVLWGGGFGTPPPPPTNVMLVAPGSDPNALADPIDFTWILDDSGSGNTDNISYFWPVAPSGYTALGVCWTNGDKPLTTNYWCVANEYCQPCTQTLFWNDQNQDWKHHNGNLSQPMLASPVAGLTVPTTFLSQEYDDNTGNSSAFAIPAADRPGRATFRVRGQRGRGRSAAR